MEGIDRHTITDDSAMDEYENEIRSKLWLFWFFKEENGNIHEFLISSKSGEYLKSQRRNQNIHGKDWNA